MCGCGERRLGGTLSVKLTVTDTLGNSATLSSGQGSQPALQLRTVQCPR